MFTADESDDRDRPAAVPDWAPIIELGGLAVLAREEIPNWAAHWKGMYDEWVKNIDVLRAELGDQSADDLLDEAKSVGPTCPGAQGCSTPPRSATTPTPRITGSYCSVDRNSSSDRRRCVM